MNKREALLVLIKHSYFLTDNVKLQLLADMDKLTDEEVDTLGEFLAIEKKNALDNNQQLIDELKSLEKELSEE